MPHSGRGGGKLGEKLTPSPFNRARTKWKIMLPKIFFPGNSLYFWSSHNILCLAVHAGALLNGAEDVCNTKILLQKCVTKKFIQLRLMRVA